MIIGRLPRRLRLVFGVEPPPAPGPPVAAPLPPLADFVAYAADCRVFGRLALPPGRLSDLLNAHEEYELVDVYLASLADGHAVAAPVVLVARDELIAVHAAGPRGDRVRRTRTRPHPLLIQAGPYTIRGDLHALPGAAPIASFHQRKPMVPLTDAWIEYVSAGTLERYRLGTVVVNRELVDWVQLTTDEAEVEPPELPAGESGPLTKDFTGQLLGFGRTGSRPA